MKIVSKIENKIVLVFERGEEVLGGLLDFCLTNKISGAVFSAIGAVEDVQLAYFDLDKKEYIAKDFSGAHELVNCAGNVSLRPSEELLVHAHGSIGDKNMQLWGGHIMKMTTAVTCEMVLDILTEPLQRKQNGAIGLDLL